jgi:hypothetical protein
VPDKRCIGCPAVYLETDPNKADFANLWGAHQACCCPRVAVLIVSAPNLSPCDARPTLCMPHHLYAGVYLGTWGAPLAKQESTITCLTVNRERPFIEVMHSNYTRPTHFCNAALRQSFVVHGHMYTVSGQGSPRGSAQTSVSSGLSSCRDSIYPVPEECGI